MKIGMKSTAILFFAAALGFAQTAGNSPIAGAKALFYDQTSGATVQSGSRKAGAKPPRAAVNLGLKYWIELVRPDSPEILQVNSTRVFHSGERIRLHLESNVDGRILLVQKASNGSLQTLFPDPKINGGDDHIKAMTDTAIPSGNGWFIFDNSPGMESITVT